MTITVPQPPDWGPLQNNVRPAALPDYMAMGVDVATLAGSEKRRVHLYKHRTTRAYLILDDAGTCYRVKPASDGYEAIHRAEAAERHPELLSETQANIA